MKHTKNRCLKPLHAGISFISIGAYLMMIAEVFFICDYNINWLRYTSITGDKAVLLRWAFVIINSLLIAIRLISLQRHLMMFHRLQTMSDGGRISCVIGMLFLPPVLEIHAIWKLKNEKLMVPNFWCDLQEEGNAINAIMLAEEIKKKYYAKADGDMATDISVLTNYGVANLLLRTASVYMFILLLGEDGEDLPINITLPHNSHWQIEKSSDDQSGAIVTEIFYPCSDKKTIGELESRLAKEIIKRLDELSALEKEDTAERSLS